MAFKVRLSRQAREYLERLAVRDKSRCRHVALLLLRLRKTPLQPDSRALRQEVQHHPGDRVWKPGHYEILYRVEEEAGEIIVAKIADRG